MRPRATRTSATLCVAVAFLICTGCTEGYLADYRFQAEGYVRAANATDGGDLQVRTAKNGIRFGGDRVDWTWSINDYGMHARCSNRSTALMAIDWNRAMFVDDHGIQSGLSTAKLGIHAFKKSAGLSAARIEPGRTAQFLAFPADRVASGTRVPARGLFEPPGLRVGTTPGEIIELARPNLGRTIRVSVPVESEGVTETYEFTFTVSEVRARRLRSLF